nr:MAG TPA: hypothetical protein [Caudoviricetes sp.]
MSCGVNVVHTHKQRRPTSPIKPTAANTFHTAETFNRACHVNICVVFHFFLFSSRNSLLLYHFMYSSAHHPPTCILHASSTLPHGGGASVWRAPLARGRVDASLKKNIKWYLHIPLPY